VCLLTTPSPGVVFVFRASTKRRQTAIVRAASHDSIAVGRAFLRYESASPPAATRSMKTHVAHRRIKIEPVYRPYLTAWEADAKASEVGVNRDTVLYCTAGQSQDY
jgi:hypothetical protein